MKNKNNDDNVKNKTNKKINIFLIYLIISLIVIIPINIDMAFAEEGKTPDYTMKKGDCTIVPPFNPKSSLILSIITLCIPGIIEKIHQLQEIKCSNVVCKYEAVKNGGNEQDCNKIKEYEKCKYLWGEVFAIPGINIYEKLRSAIVEAIKNPVGIAMSIGAKLARKHLDSCGVGARSCTSWENIIFAISLSIIDITALYTTIANIGKNKPMKTPEYTCDKLPEIKEELEKIVATIDEKEKENNGSGSDNSDNSNEDEVSGGSSTNI